MASPSPEGKDVRLERNNATKSEFEKRIFPHVEVLLEISLGLTKNGLDATRLLRETIGVACLSWNESAPKEVTRLWLHDILNGQYLNGFQLRARQPVPEGSDILEQVLNTNKYNRLSPIGASRDLLEVSSTALSKVYTDFFQAIASLPEAFRLAMSLSYIEGLTIREIADLVNTQPRRISTLLYCGYRLLREELFVLLTSNNGLDAFASPEAQSA